MTAAGAWLQSRALAFKIFGVGFLGLVLLIPLSLVRSTLDERATRRTEAISEITRVWGDTQQLVGPILIVPYTHRVVSENWVAPGGQRMLETSSREETSEAFFLPESLDVIGTIETSTRQRGIYRADVYSAQVRLTGHFAKPNFAFTGATAIEPQWQHARVYFGVSDLRGARGALALGWNGTSYPVEPTGRSSLFGPGVQTEVPMNVDATGADFSLAFTVNGSGGFFVAPLGRTTHIHLASAWPDPSFAGAFLPTSRSVGPNGFQADWQLSYYGSAVPPQWSDRGTRTPPTAQVIRESTLGVNFHEVVNAYRTVDRATKYGVLFIALVLGVFFLFEILAGVRLHALNYLLVGSALCLFYLALLALSEFLAFALAYSVAATASVALIGCYSRSILARRARAWTVSMMISGVYAYLYFVLQMEDFSLLAGTAALFAIVGALMFATRRVRPAPPPPLSAAPAAI